MERFQRADSTMVGVFAVCVVIMSSPNMASYFSMLLIYCLHSTKIGGVDGKKYVFGEPPQFCPCREQFYLLWAFFGVPSMLEKDVLMSMDPIPRAQLLMLHVLYLPPLRVILIVIGFPTILAYCWLTFPLAAFLLAGALLVSKVMLWEINRAMEKRGFNRRASNAMANTLRWNMMLPVVFVPVMSVGTVMGVRFYSGEGYWASFENSFTNPTFPSYEAFVLKSASAGVYAAYQLVR